MPRPSWSGESVAVVLRRLIRQILLVVNLDVHKLRVRLFHVIPPEHAPHARLMPLPYAVLAGMSVTRPTLPA